MSQLMLVGELDRASLRDRVLLMRAQPMFEGLDDEGLLRLAEHGRSVRYRDGEIVSREGEPARSVYLVTHGKIVVSLANNGENVRRAGDAYGGLQLLARQPSSLAVARGETRTLEMPATAFESTLIENYSLLRNTLRMIGSSVLATRNSLPADPNLPRVVDEGTYSNEPRTMVQRLLDLRQSSFGHLNLEALVDMARGMFEVRYPAGHLLWSAGDPSTHSLHIEAGRVRCTAPDGRSIDVGHRFTIGVLDVWGSRQRVYDARTETPVTAARIDFESFLSLLEAHPEVGLELLRGFARVMLEGL